MDTYEKEKEEWKELLDSGQIDEMTYKKEISKINYMQRKNISRENYKLEKKQKKIDEDSKLSKDEKKFKKVKKLKIILTTIAVALMLLYIPFNIRRTSFHPLSKKNIEDPVQKEASGSRTDRINSVSMKIDYLYTYSISGRVVSTYNYVGDSIYNRIAPIDVGMTWGVLSTAKNNSKIKFSHKGDRFLYPNITGDFSEITKYDRNYINTHFSNNHLIPKSNEVLNKIKKIKENDFIKIDGFLVDVTASYKNSFLTLESSTTRNDTGDGACEIIFVSDITWL